MPWTFYTNGGELIESAQTLDGFTSDDFVKKAGDTMTGALIVNGIIDSTSLIRSTRSLATEPAFRAQVSGDATPRMEMRADGKITWGPGNAAVDTNIYRSGVDILKTDSALEVVGNLIPHSYATRITDITTGLSETDHYLGLNTLSALGGFIVTLPDQATNEGKEFVLADLQGDAHNKNVTIAVQAGDELNGVTDGTYVINVPYESVKLISFGASGWFIV